MLRFGRKYPSLNWGGTVPSNDISLAFLLRWLKSHAVFPKEGMSVATLPSLEGMLWLGELALSQLQLLKPCGIHLCLNFASEFPGSPFTAIWAFARFCLSLSTVAGAYNKKSSLNFPMRFVMSFWQPITHTLYLKLNFIILTCFWSKDQSSAFARRHGNSPAKVRCGIPGLHERRWWAVQSVGDASDARQKEPTKF